MVIDDRFPWHLHAVEHVSKATKVLQIALVDCQYYLCTAVVISQVIKEN